MTASPRTTRPRLARLFVPAVLTLTTALGSGCVSQLEADAARDKYRASEELVLKLRQQLEEAEESLALLRSRTNPNPAFQDRIAVLEAQVASLEASLEDARAALSSAAGAPLPAILTSELERLAEANPDLMTFDADTGMIRFRSDVTFALGRTDVRDGAENLLNQLAGVLNSPAASGYEVRVVGHTDNVPVRNAANVQKYEDNWGMSAFRAISVMRVLNAAGVPAARMSIAGYGENQPVVSNGPRGAEANRRVEIFLVPRNEPVAATPAPSAQPGPVEAMTAPAPSEDDNPALFK
ncbi:MAG: OmpA family protein [Planctomycetota bacterium]